MKDSKNTYYTVTTKSTHYFAKKESGGKGHNLYLLGSNGINVPEFITLPPQYFEEFKKQSGITDYLQNILLDSHLSMLDVSEKIRIKISETKMPESIFEEIKRAYEYLNKNLISVRSSAHDEDSALHSFAGQLSSFLYVASLDKTVQTIKECWASAYSERSLHYRQINKLDILNIKVSVILQEMIDPDMSGVFFTCNPINGKNDQLFINAVYGVGEGLVSGLLDADTFVLNKSDGAIIEKNIVEKTKKLVRDIALQSCIEVSVDSSSVNADSLNSTQLSELRNIATRIENFYGRPQDVEWAFKDGVLYILQSRPVTTNTENSTGLLYLWDNSNIVESYGGLTMPLTFGFAHYVYHQVYVQFCEILLVPQSRIKEMDYFLRNMLGLFYGRVYYNLLNWYKLTSILPGYKYNRSFMETMMGTNESLQDEIAERVKPPEFHKGAGAKLRSFVTGLKFFYFHLNIQNVVDSFLKEFHIVYNKFRRIDYSRLSSDKIYEHYQALEREMLWQWHAPIINDFLCMIHYGMFKNITHKWLGHLGDSFHNDLLAGNGNLESAEPTKRLIVMSGYVSKIPGLKSLILSTPNENCLEAINQSEYQEFYKMVLDYIDRYGFRCMSEMKLEQKDMHLEPGLFFVFIKNLINCGQTDLHEYEKREKEIRENAEDLLYKNISGVKKIIYKWSLKHARKAVMNRENTRFCRTRIYGIVRAMFYAIGEDFTKSNIIDKKDDIFFLSLEELKGALEGTNSIQNLRLVINVRKNEYELYKNLEPAARFATRGPVYYNNQHMPKEEEVVFDESSLLPNQMRGIPCSPGIIEGIVKVIIDSNDDMTLNGEILVTERTDPGWIPLYPSLSALLVERGGLLSHSAIVAREMGLPTIVGIKGLTKKLKSGMKIRINGETGIIDILD
ncbi:MAG: phosphoenolpyruvate synthase [Bacteriovoracaceae bacterium]|nr:phosphoenolpyruvate synthase [Bacteriovoracaceae bacterium]